MTTAVIVDAVRTAGGRRHGRLSGWHPVDLAAETLKALVERNDLDPGLIDDVIMGCVMQVGAQAINVGRNAVLAAGFPESVPGSTIDRQCGSSQQALHFAAQGVMAGQYDVAVAAGVEVMSLVPMGASVGQGVGVPFGPTVGRRYQPVGGLVPQGISAEMVADKWDLSREDLDRYSARSQQYAARATAEGRFEREILPVAARHKDKETGQDHRIRRAGDHGRRHPARHHRRGARQSQAGVQTGRQGDGGQQLADHGRRLGGPGHERGKGVRPAAHAPGPLSRLRPGRRRSRDDADRPHPRHHQGAGASQVDARRHRPDRDQRGLRVRGAGLGEGAPPRHGARQRQRRRHCPGPPPGLLGTKLMSTLLNELERTGGRYGLQTMCEGGGMANATIIERLG